MSQRDLFRLPRKPWNAGRMTGSKAPLKTAEDTRRKAEHLAPLRLGVVAFTYRLTQRWATTTRIPRSRSRPASCRCRGMRIEEPAHAGIVLTCLI